MRALLHSQALSLNLIVRSRATGRTIGLVHGHETIEKATTLGMIYPQCGNNTASKLLQEEQETPDAKKSLTLTSFFGAKQPEE